MNDHSTTPRDISLDILKGIACLLMIIAHARTLGKTIDTPITLVLWYVGFYAPILFFFAIGPSMSYQLKKYNPGRFLVFNILLFLISFADVGRSVTTYFDLGQINLFGSLALCAIGSYLLLRYISKSVLIVIVPIIIDRVFNRVGLPPTILHGELFSIFPWMSFILLGAFFYYRKRVLYGIGLGSFICALVLHFVSHAQVTSQDTTTLYLLLSCACCAAAVCIADMLPTQSVLVKILTDLGKNSLLFYWVHLLLFTYIDMKQPAAVVWILIFVLTYLCMTGLQWLYSRLPLKQVRLWVWALLFLVLPVPYIFHLQMRNQTALFFCVLIVFSLTYRLIVMKIMTIFPRPGSLDHSL